MKKDYFENTTYCTLIIISNIVSPSQITEELGITPSEYHEKGDITISKTTGAVITKTKNRWAVKSEIYQREY